MNRQTFKSENSSFPLSDSPCQYTHGDQSNTACHLKWKTTLEASNHMLQHEWDSLLGLILSIYPYETLGVICEQHLMDHLSGKT